MRRLANKTQRALAFLLALGVLVSGSWIADGIKGEVLFADWSSLCDWFNLFRNPLYGLLGACVLFSLASYGLYLFRHAFAPVQSLSKHLCDPHKSLILFVSTPSPGTKLACSGKEWTLSFADEKKITFGSDLCTDIAALDKLVDYRWNWQQLMRAIRPHKNSICLLHLVGSEGQGGSFSHLHTCKDWLKGYLPDIEITTNEEPGIDFQDFNAIIHHIHATIAGQKERPLQLRDSDMVIDVTGGTSMASVAAAASTLNSRVTFQYVQDHKDVYAYDVAYLPWDQ